MAGENAISVIGNLTADPELRYLADGTPVTSFSVATSFRVKDPDGTWRDGETSFFRVNAWRSLAENVVESLTKGTRVIVTGRLKQHSWDAEGGRRSQIEIEADDVGLSLRWSSATMRPHATAGATAAGPG